MASREALDARMTPYRPESGNDEARANVLGPGVLITIRSTRIGHSAKIIGEAIAMRLNAIQEEAEASREEENVRFPLSDELSEK